MLCMQLWSISEIVNPASGTTCKPNREHTCRVSKLLTQVSVVLWRHTFVGVLHSLSIQSVKMRLPVWTVHTV